MVLGHKHDISCSSRFDRAHPLVWIELGGTEDLRVGGAVTPLAIQKGIGAKVNDHSELEILPFNLLRRWFDICEILRARAKSKDGNQKRDLEGESHVFRGQGC